MIHDNVKDKIVWGFYKDQLQDGYFTEYDENGFENYDDKNLFESIMDHYGSMDAIKVIQFNKDRGMEFSSANLMYVYDWMDWRGLNG